MNIAAERAEWREKRGVGLSLFRAELVDASAAPGLKVFISGSRQRNLPRGSAGGRRGSAENLATDGGTLNPTARSFNIVLVY